VVNPTPQTYHMGMVEIPPIKRVIFGMVMTLKPIGFHLVDRFPYCGLIIVSHLHTAEKKTPNIFITNQHQPSLSSDLM
jgi:hypothetical protein